MKLVYESKFNVSFSDVDSAGIVYFARFLDFAHKALEDFARDKGVYNTWFNSKEIAAPIKMANLDFKAPLRLNDEVRTQVYLSEQTEHSLSFKVQFHVENQLCCEASTVHVFIDKQSKTKRPVPADIFKSQE